MKPDTIFALRPLTKAAIEVVPAIVDFSAQLVSGETLTGTPTVTIDPVGPTLGSATVNTSAVTPRDGGDAVAIGKGIQFTISGGTARSRYTLTISCNTTTSGRVAAGKTILVIDV